MPPTPALSGSPSVPNSFSCHPWTITDNNDGGCGRFFPRFHPKNALPLAHNNDPNAPFQHRGIYHLFMQANLHGWPGYNGAIGIGHLASEDLATWKVLPPALVPGRWGGTPGTVGQPGGNATGGSINVAATTPARQQSCMASHGL